MGVSKCAISKQMITRVMVHDVSKGWIGDLFQLTSLFFLVIISTPAYRWFLCSFIIPTAVAFNHSPPLFKESMKVQMGLEGSNGYSSQFIGFSMYFRLFATLGIRVYCWLSLLSCKIEAIPLASRCLLLSELEQALSSCVLLAVCSWYHHDCEFFSCLFMPSLHSAFSVALELWEEVD